MTTMPDEVDIHDAKARLSALITKVEAGEEIVITRFGRRVARLVPLATDDADDWFAASTSTY